MLHIAFWDVGKDSRKYESAIEAVETLFTMASQSRENEERAHRYVMIAEKIAARMDITLKPTIKRSYCKKCKTLYGSSTQIRLSSKIMTVKCGHCGSIRRIPY